MALQTIWTAQQPQGSSNPNRSLRLGYGRDSINKSLELQSALTTAMGMTWTTDIESHVKTINGHLHQVLASHHCPKRTNVAKKPYIGPQLWDLRSTKLKARSALKALKSKQATHQLTACFLAWKASRVPDPADEELQAQHYNYGVSLRCFTVKYLALHRTVSFQLRSSLRTAKLQRLQEQIAQLPADVSASVLLRDLKHFIGPTNPKKCKAKALPLIHKSDGEPCTTPQELVDCWINFFQTMEGGCRMPEQVLRDSWISALQQVQSQTQTIDLTSLPTLLDLEGAYGRVASFPWHRQ